MEIENKSLDQLVREYLLETDTAQWNSYLDVFRELQQTASSSKKKELASKMYEGILGKMSTFYWRHNYSAIPAEMIKKMKESTNISPEKEMVRKKLDGLMGNPHCDCDVYASLGLIRASEIVPAEETLNKLMDDNVCEWRHFVQPVIRLIADNKEYHNEKTITNAINWVTKNGDSLEMEMFVELISKQGTKISPDKLTSWYAKETKDFVNKLVDAYQFSRGRPNGHYLLKVSDIIGKGPDKNIVKREYNRLKSTLSSAKKYHENSISANEALDIYKGVTNLKEK